MLHSIILHIAYQHILHLAVWIFHDSTSIFHTSIQLTQTEQSDFVYDSFIIPISWCKHNGQSLNKIDLVNVYDLLKDIDNIDFQFVS